MSVPFALERSVYEDGNSIAMENVSFVLDFVLAYADFGSRGILNKALCIRYVDSN
jgi:hypothetical protein